jgi:hypothetical protein
VPTEKWPHQCMAEQVSARCTHCTPDPLCAFLQHACVSPPRRVRASTGWASGAYSITLPPRPCADHVARSYSSFLLLNTTPWGVSPCASPLWAARSFDLGCVLIAGDCDHEGDPFSGGRAPGLSGDSARLLPASGHVSPLQNTAVWCQ